MEEKFKAIIPAGVDRARLNEFMEACRTYYKQTLVQVKESAITAPDDFFAIFHGWLKKHSKEEKKNCPDRGPIDPSACSSCGSRTGCSAWRSGGEDVLQEA